MTPDRHLGAAKIDRCLPDVLITESTYATTIRDSKRCRERDFLIKVHECVKRGGKVLIPVFALGRAQELCILLDTYWDRMQINVPIYFTLGLTERATNYYKLFITWTNEKVRETFVDFNMFDFKHISTFHQSVLDSDKPVVVFATPGMLHGGTSLQIFKRWASDAKNMIIMPGYCTRGTVGARILNGEKTIEFADSKQVIEVKLEVEYMSFSVHADAKGIMQLVQNCQPKHVVLVHGEAEKMRFLSAKITTELQLPCHYPANGQCIALESDRQMPALAITSFIDTIRARYESYFFSQLTREMQRYKRQTPVAAGNTASTHGNKSDADMMMPASSPVSVPVNFYPVEGVFIVVQHSSDGTQKLYLFDRDTAAVRLHALAAALNTTATITPSAAAAAAAATSNSSAAADSGASRKSPAQNFAVSVDDDSLTRKILANPAYRSSSNATVASSSSSSSSVKSRHKFWLRATLPLPRMPAVFRAELLTRAEWLVGNVVLFAHIKLSDSKLSMSVNSIQASVVVNNSSANENSTAAEADVSGKVSVELAWLCEDDDIIDDVVEGIELAAKECCCTSF